MTAKELAKLKAEYDDWTNKLKAKGIKFVPYKVPCCGGQLESRLASKGDVWDTLATCPHCGGLYMKITTSKKVTALKPNF